MLSLRTKESVKTALAVVIVIAIAFYMGWEKPYWAVLVVNYRSSSDGGMKCPSEV